MTPVFVAAGSNIDPRHKLKFALSELERRFGPLRVSRAYQNTAVGFDGPDFINLAFGFQTDLDLHAVLARLHEVEALCGRERGAPKWESRAMDLDVLLFGDTVLQEPGIKLPRPDLLKRAFMLGPLAEIAGEVVHPVLGKTIAQLWHEFDRDAHALTAVDLND